MRIVMSFLNYDLKRKKSSEIEQRNVVDQLTIAGHSIILIAYILTTALRWWRWWFVLVAGRWARRVRRRVRRWILIMLIICTRWNFIYTFAATRAMFAVLVLVLILLFIFIFRRRRRVSRSAPASGDAVRRYIWAAWVRNLSSWARRRALCCAARFFLLATWWWRRCKSCSC